jgi:hypothetical protein
MMSFRRLRIHPWLALACFAAVGACASNENSTPGADDAPEVQQACTLIGCADGITVTIDGDVPTTYTVALLDGDRELTTMECQAGSPCEVMATGAQPEEVTVEIRSDAGTERRTVALQYETTRPNGPDCPPECRHGRGLVTL